MNIKNQFKLISTEAEVRELISYCKITRYASIDFETSNFKFYEGKEYPTILGCSFQIGFTYIILLGHFESPNKDNYIPLLQIFFKEVIEDPEIVKIAWNIAYEHKWIKRYGYSLRGRCFDAMLAKYLLNEERPNDLKSQVNNYLPSWSKYETELPEDGDWSKIPLEKLAPYNAIDCDAALRLFIFFESKLIKHKFYRTFRNLIMPTRLRVLDEMEFKGMCINRKYLEKTTLEQAERIKLNEDDLRRHPRLIKFSKYRERAHIKKLIDAVQKEIEEIQDDEDRKNKDKLIKARELKVQNYIQGKLTTKKELLEEFNFNSPDQLGQFLFTKKGMNLPIIEYTKSGAPSTAEAALIELKQYDKSSFIEQLLNHRGMVALYNTFLKGMLERLSTKDKVHASFLIHGTVTGRLSSRGPNLQNIPRVTTSDLIKPMFVPPKGFLLLEVDYSQAELRVVAEIANETNMIDIFRRGYNIHLATACKANKVLDRYSEMKAIYDDPNHKDNLFWIKQHKRAKLINFGILYGQTKYKLAIELGCSHDEAQIFIDEWFEMYPAIGKWIKKQHRQAKREGYVMSLWGRKRRLPLAMFENEREAKQANQFGQWLEALRQSVNAPIQGIASDFTLFSSLIIREEQLKGNLPMSLRQTATVHDSLLFYIEPKDIHKTVPKIVEICNNPQTERYFGFQLTQVRMKVSPEIGRTWADLQDYNPWQNYKKWI